MTTLNAPSPDSRSKHSIDLLPCTPDDTDAVSFRDLVQLVHSRAPSGYILTVSLLPISPLPAISLRAPHVESLE